tara:strand:+ start:344 stop:802 length:459 start_codon:yes stop_codon:yes gene_type:complete
LNKRLEDISYIERWEGCFLYLVENINYDVPIVVGFSILVEIKNDSFIGTHSDEESAHLFDEDSIIKGYLEDNFISFTLNYPYLYFIDDYGNHKTDKSKDHPEIHYFGNFDMETNSYIGSWELYEEFKNNFGDTIIDKFASTWDFKIVSSKEK